MTIDPVGLGKITPELIDEFVPALKGYAASAGTEGFAINAACLMLETIADKLRTGQLVPAQPSGDEVQAVARAICEASGDVWRTGEGMRSPFAAQADRVNNHWRFKATAAIAALDAVRKARENGDG